MLLHFPSPQTIHEIPPTALQMQNFTSWNSSEVIEGNSFNRSSHHRGDNDVRSSNRSRKAEPHVNGDTLVGNDLLDHVTRGYSDLSIRTQSTTPVSSHGSSRFKSDTPNLSLGGVLFHDPPRRSPSPAHHRSDGVWSTRIETVSRSTSVGDPNITGGFHRKNFESSRPVRPHSAAPQVGPPPGIRVDPRPSSSFAPSPAWEFSRSSSVEVGDEPAVRPAAKTLMELIQEDVPPPSPLNLRHPLQDPVSPGNAGLSPNPHLRRDDAHYLSPPLQAPPIRTQTYPQHDSLPTDMFSQQHSHVSRPSSQQQQQQVLFNQQRQVPNNIRVQAVPGNQQMFVGSGPQPGYQQYSSMQFPQGPHQTAQIVRIGDQQYVTIPSGAQQVSYWPNPSAPPSMQGSEVMSANANAFVGGQVEPSMQQFRPRGDKNGGRRGPRRRVDSKGTTSSMLLEDFRASKSRDWTIKRIEGHISEFCQDQNGSRFIQQRLEMGDIMEQQIVMKEVLPAIRALRTDVFGNYVVQKLLDFGTPKMKQEIKDTLEGEMLQLSLQMYGCRVVQKALETLEEDDLPRLLREFHHNVLNCIHDQNGNHVIQKCIEVLNTRAKKAFQMGDFHRASFLGEQVDFIIDDVLVNTTSLSCHPYGCRVLQRMLEHCTEGRKTEVLDQIKICHKTLLDDQYGNYVIQHVLQYGREEDRDSLLKIIAESGLLRLSRQKFASNVVEKLLKYGNGNQRRGIVREMLKITEDPAMHASQPQKRVSVVLLMVRDAYANYVVQTTLDVVPESEERRALLKELNSCVDELRNYTFAKHIVVKLGVLNERM